jgi:transposase
MSFEVRMSASHRRICCRNSRSAVERFFGWLKSFRRIIIRYEKLASTYKALVTIASIIIHLRYGILR